MRNWLLHRLSLHHPLVLLSCRPLVVLSLRRPLIVSSHRLVVASPLIAPPSRRLLSPPLLLSCAGWLLRCLLLRRPLVVPPSCPLVVLSLHHPLVVSSHRLVVALPLIALPCSCPLPPPLVVLCQLVAVLPLVALPSLPLVMPPSCPLVVPTSNLSSLGFPDPFDATFVVPWERSSRTSPVWPLAHARWCRRLDSRSCTAAPMHQQGAPHSLLEGVQPKICQNFKSLL